MTRVLVLAYDRIGERMAGPGVRSWEIACAIAKHAEVTIASETEIGRSHPGVTTVRIRNDRHFKQLCDDADVVLVQGLALRRFQDLHVYTGVLVVDLYDPWVLENVEQHAHLPNGRCAELLLADADAQNELLDAGDFFICASERQRDYWLGMLTSRGRIDRATWLADAELRDLIDVVPYGAPTGTPTGGGLKGVHPNIAADDTVLLWSGGVWEWFDPLLAVEAFADAARVEPKLVFYFMGLGLSGSSPDMPIAQQLHARAGELAEEGIRIAFGDWVPYDERGSILADADAAIIATRPSVEARLAFRSRVLDHFWAGLPTLTTPGDVLADVIEEHDAGKLYPFGDRTALTEAILDLRREPERVATWRTNARALADSYRWSSTTAPLQRVAGAPARWLEIRRTRMAHFAECGVEPSFRGGVHPTAAMLHGGFHRRGPVIDRLKRSGLYPFMRWFRRTPVGHLLWGPVPGE